MRHLRRCHALFLERTETVTLDPLALLQGDSGLATTLGWRALTAHLPEPVALDDAEVIRGARDLAERVLDDDRSASDPLLADLMTKAELLAAGEWMEKS